MADCSIRIDVDYGPFNVSTDGPPMLFGGYTKNEVKELVMHYAKYVCDQLDRISDED